MGLGRGILKTPRALRSGCYTIVLRSLGRIDILAADLRCAPRKKDEEEQKSGSTLTQKVMVLHQKISKCPFIIFTVK